MTEYGMLVGAVAAAALQCRTQVLRDAEEHRLREVRRMIRALVFTARSVRGLAVVMRSVGLRALASRLRPLRVVAVLGFLMAIVALRAGQFLLAVAEWMSTHALDD